MKEKLIVSFHKILHQTNVENVLSALKAHYKSSENDIIGFRELINELSAMQPVSSRYQISIEHVCEDDDEYENVFGVIPGDDQPYGIEFAPFEEWLGMHLTEETLTNYSAEDIIAHCLWEMTFFGFSDAEIQRKKDELIDSCPSVDGKPVEMFPQDS